MASHGRQQAGTAYPPLRCHSRLGCTEAMSAAVDSESDSDGEEERQEVGAGAGASVQAALETAPVFLFLADLVASGTRVRSVRRGGT